MNNEKKMLDLFISKADELLLKREKRNFEFDDENRSVVEFFISYFWNSELLKTMGGQAQKGIYLYGGYGTGKSLLFEILEQLDKSYPNCGFRIKTVHTLELTDDLQRQLANPNQLAINDKSIYSKHSTGHMHFEDLGAERKINHYGNSIETMSDILQLRYNTSKRRSCKTFITTNLSPDDFKKRYGERCYDRMFEMFNILEVRGGSRRK